MKKPEEIKKGLELCVNAYSIDYPCDECPYVEEDEGCKNMMEDALSLIQQLVQIAIHWQSSMDQVQKALQDNGFLTLEELMQAYSQVKAERDAAVKYLRAGHRCFVCKMFFHNGGRCSGGRYCVPMNFEWRGVQEKEEEHEVDSH